MTAPQLFGLALSILRSRDLAEDIVQDSFVLVWRQAHSFDPSRGAAMAWLARIVRNRCFDLLRRRERESPLDDVVMQTWEDPASSPADITALSQEAKRLRDCLGGAKSGTHLVNLQKPWRRIRRKAGISDVRLHDLRHSFASVAVGLGEGLPMIGKLLGHTQTQTTARYAHLAADPVKAATERVGAALVGMLSGQNANIVDFTGRRRS